MFGRFGFQDNFLGGNFLAPFKKTLSCYPVSFMEGKARSDVDDGGKIILPPSSLEELTRRNIQYPMLFKLTNVEGKKSTHCGVLEFVADEGKAYMPYWMMNNLFLQVGNYVTIENVSLSTATYVKLQPQSVDFLDITNPKAVLEKALRLFACLSKGDMIAISYNDKRYEFNVLELKPADAVSIIECDMNVDFAPPVGYKEPERVPVGAPMEEEDEIDYAAIRSAQQTGFKVFSCTGTRLDGKKKDSRASTSSEPDEAHQRGVPNYDYKIGKLNFIRNGRSKTDETEDKSFSAFQGEGNLLKNVRNRK